MNEKITIRIERPCWGNGQMGTLHVDYRLDPILLEQHSAPGGFLVQMIGNLINQLDREAKAIGRADEQARKEGRL